MSSILQFWKRKQEFCVFCKRELQHKYKPHKEWKITGMLCSDCHIIKMKEYIAQQQIEKEKQERELNTCSICLRLVKSDTDLIKPKWQWNLERATIMCKSCYEKKQTEFEKERNYCSICGTNLKFIRYNPKPKWKISGQLCRKCWDQRNELQ
ncbi:MAG TPA: hypothetical protein VFV86_01580 [Nitrososphaeraceae archaeon]|nr:hypothetical protein [Nitrososphaeraceae archaeon]